MLPRAPRSPPGRAAPATDRHSGNGSASAASQAISVTSTAPSTGGSSNSWPDGSLAGVTSVRRTAQRLAAVGVLGDERGRAHDLLEHEHVVRLAARVDWPRSVARVAPRGRQQAVVAPGVEATARCRSSRSARCARSRTPARRPRARRAAPAVRRDHAPADPALRVSSCVPRSSATFCPVDVEVHPGAGVAALVQA